jgi:transcriptional regulator with XRE-family HTH domain
MEDKNVFGDRLRHMRKKAGLTLQQLGDKVGLDNSTISNYEMSKMYPSYFILLRLLDVFDCSLDYLTGLDDEILANRSDVPDWLEELIPVLDSIPRLYRKPIKEFVLSLEDDREP